MTGPTPLIVIEGSRDAIAGEARRFEAGGFAIVDGFRGATPRGRPVIRTGTVASAMDASDALLAALAGSGLIVAATADRATIDRLVDDLRRLGPVDHRIGSSEAPAPVLDQEARSLLALLAEGHSLGEAAVLLGLSRRTADRRLASLRTALGVERTTEAIARARRLGWFGAGRGDR